MAAITYFCNFDITGALTTTDPGAEFTSVTGWTVAKVAPTTYSQMDIVAVRASSSFAATVQPSVTPADSNTVFDYIIGPAISGTFDAGVWAATMKVIASSSGGDQDGNLRFRIWKAPAATKNGSVELTSAAVDCGTVTNLTTAAAQASSGSTPSIGPFTLTNERLLLVVAWKITGAGGANTRDVLLRVGTGITLVTPNFTATAATKAPPFQARTARNMLLRR